MQPHHTRARGTASIGLVATNFEIEDLLHCSSLEKTRPLPCLRPRRPAEGREQKTMSSRPAISSSTREKADATKAYLEQKYALKKKERVWLNF